MTYGDFVKALRNEKKLTRKEACETLSISVQTLTRIEGNKVCISLELMGELCRFFNIDISAFLSFQTYNVKNLISTKTFDVNEFAKTLVFLRNKNNLSQIELAKIINVSNNKISLWENAKSLPSVIEFSILCTALNVNADDFYFANIIPQKKIVTLFDTAKEKFIKIFSTVCLGIILCGIASFNTHTSLNVRNPLSQKPNINADDNLFEGTKPTPIKKYTVTYKYQMLNDVIIKEFNEGSKVPFLPLPVTINGYKLTNYTYQNEVFDFDNYRLHENITLYGNLEKKIYNVKFYAGDNKTVLKELKVPYLEDAISPNIELVDIYENKRFLRWSENFSKVTEDLEIYPIYNYHESKITFNDVEGATFNDFNKYSHQYFSALPTPPSSYKTFIGWFYNDKPFTIDTPLDEEMTLTSKYLDKDAVSLKFPRGDGTYMHYYFVAGYKMEFLPGLIKDNLLATRFKSKDKVLSYPLVFDDTDVILEPIFDTYIEYYYDGYNIIITELRSDATEFYIPYEINGKTVSKICDEALVLPNCEKLVIGAQSVTIAKDAFKLCPNIKELYIKDYKCRNETVTFETNLLSPLHKLRTLEIPEATNVNGNPINISELGLDPNIKGLEFKLSSDVNVNALFNETTTDFKSLIIYLNFYSITEYPFARRIDLKNVPLDKFKNLKRVDFTGTINEIYLSDVSKTNAIIRCNSDLEILNLYNSSQAVNYIHDELKIVSKKTFSLLGDEKLYAKTIDLSYNKSISFYETIKLFPIERIYLPDFYALKNKKVNLEPCIFNLTNGHKVDVYFDGPVPQNEELKKIFKGTKEDLSASFNFFALK